MMDVEGLVAYLDQHGTRSAYRWECQPVYEVATDGSDYKRYIDGELNPDWERLQPWLEHLAEEKSRGFWRHRVRLFHTPLHPYERYESEWGYELTGAAGEDIRVLDPADHATPAPLVDHDYWLLDDRHPLRMHYGDDGSFIGATEEPSLLNLYRRARDIAWENAEPFTTWWARHQEHHRWTRRAA